MNNIYFLREEEIDSYLETIEKLRYISFQKLSILPLTFFFLHFQIMSAKSCRPKKIT